MEVTYFKGREALRDSCDENSQRVDALTKTIFKALCLRVSFGSGKELPPTELVQSVA